MQETENGDGNADYQSHIKTCLWRTKRSRSQYESRTENLHGAYLAYTRRRTREPKAGQRGGKTVRGEKTQGRKQRLRSRPLLQQTPVLHCDRCPFLWNGEHVLVLLAVDCIGWLFCVSKRRNVTEPRDRWGLWSLAGRGSVCPIPCHLTPRPGHRTTDSNDWSGHLEEDLFCEAAS